MSSQKEESLSQNNPQELVLEEARGALFQSIVQKLASTAAVTVRYYVPGSLEPAIEREGADWERFIILGSPDGRYTIGINMLHNDPDWQSKGSLRLTPRGEEDSVQAIFLDRETNLIGRIIIGSSRYIAETEIPHERPQVYVQELGQQYGRFHGGWREHFDEGRIIGQMPQYPSARELSEDEQREWVGLISAAEFDPVLMQKASYWMTQGRHESSVVVDSDPFYALLSSATLPSPTEN